MNQKSDLIKLEEISTNKFSPELFLQCILYRSQLSLDLSYFLEQAIYKKVVDDNNNFYNLQILRICVVCYNYYQLLQGTNFLNKDKYAGMANQLKKIFRDEKEYLNQITQFSNVKSNTADYLRKEIQMTFEKCKKLKDAVPAEFSKIVNYFRDTKKGDLKFEKLQTQLDATNQINYDIYSYFFKLYYQQEWFTQNQNLEAIKLQCFIIHFLKLDSIYPIELFADQTLIFVRILDNQPIDYYKKLMDQN
ncbi:unnamed protein product (macronuclear) [Paramecium tetraurelia]|uniref:Uncharacterized protein n=1 Tax=Paramecium tetraurelia TaxID=5888 RepID=A0CA85_PARTE|nr:uncharacterized protein GSPATT00036482001 [Paramecium tetraurelia]CAK67702.1 unnamed protein product [Paramecium tetraurelia]|eukprot:XP_001435099.1 hypothetical protein (macronuclear) [Paramecium tetraurelia strain d4-2]